MQDVYVDKALMAIFCQMVLIFVMFVGRHYSHFTQVDEYALAGSWCEHKDVEEALKFIKKISSENFCCSLVSSIHSKVIPMSMSIKSSYSSHSILLFRSLLS